MAAMHELDLGRELTATESTLVATILAKAAEVGDLVEQLRTQLPAFVPDGEPVQLGGQVLVAVTSEAYETDRWLQIGQDHLQQGFMALQRAVLRPVAF